MHIVATGATSFVGLGAVKELLRRGHFVTAVLRENSVKTELLKENGAFPEGLKIVYEDLGSLSRLPGKTGGRCDVFLHMGWRGAGSDSRKNGDIQKQSVQDTMCAVRTAREMGVKRFLFTGSQAEYGLRSSLTDEEAPCKPTSPYGQAKLEVRYHAEELCAELSMDYGHVRIFSVYGPGDHPWSLISSCVKAFRNGQKMELSSCTQLWNFLYIDDAARALASLAEYSGSLAEQGCVYNLGGPMEETRPLRLFVEEIYDLCGRKGEMNYGVKSPNAEGIVNLIPDIRKMEKVLGWHPDINFKQGMTNILRKL